jgi:hypothetical protein
MLQKPSICILTPSYRGDIEQFALLRESIRLFAPGLPHLVLVHTEDHGLFKRRFGSDTNLEIIRSEYNLLGYAATFLEHCENYSLIECSPSSLHHSVRFPEDKAHFETEMRHMLSQPKQFALIQSTLKLDTARIAAAFHRLVKGQSEAEVEPSHSDAVS